MDKQQAEIVLLKAALLQSNNTIEFLHGCLTEPTHFSYDYPEETFKVLDNNQTFVEKQLFCVHASFVESCVACQQRVEQKSQIEQAQKVFNN